MDSISRRPFVIAIRRVLILMIPFMMLGSFGIFLNNLPIPAYQQLMLGFFGEGWRDFGSLLYQATFSLMSILLVLTISYSLVAERLKGPSDTGLTPMLGAITALACLFTLLHTENDNIALADIGTLGVFIAMLTAVCASQLFSFLHSFKNMRLKLYSNTAESNFSQVIISLFPAIITVSFFVAIRLTLGVLEIADIHGAIYDGLRYIFMNMSSTFSSCLAFVTLTHFFWFFGIHGNNVLEPVAHSILIPALEVNKALVAQGLPPTEIFTKQFFDVFVYLGGSGTTMSLICATLLWSKRSSTRHIAKLSLLPGLINVNELVIFGIPIVLNFYLLIPFILTPAALTLVSYSAMQLGLVPLTVQTVEWTTPIILGGYTVTGGSINGAILQIFNLALGIGIYYPFIKLYEKSLCRDTQRTLKNLFNDVMKLSEQQPVVLLNKRDAEGNLARDLVADLQRDFKARKLYLHYQPQIAGGNRIHGAEALLRWRHEELGMIAPPITIALAEESGLLPELGLWIFKKALQAQGELMAEGYGPLIMSVNITPSQLDIPSLAADFKDIADKLAIPPELVEIEITEQAALGGVKRLEVIRELQQVGFRLAMDDFGMGHSSLMYIKEFNLSTIKLDGGLIQDIESNQSSSEIISSIVYLCRSMNIHILAEYVENEQQLKILQNLGCDCYQGYFYSPALPLEQLKAYIRDFQSAQENIHNH